METPLRPHPSPDLGDPESIPLFDLFDSISLLIDPDISIAVVLQIMAGSELDQAHLFRPDPQTQVSSSDQYTYGVIGSQHQVLGLVTAQDLLTYAANPDQNNTQPIQTVISPLCVFRSMDYTGVEDLISWMQEQRCRWLPVLNDQDQLLGVISLETLYLRLARQTQAFQSRSLQLQIQQERTFYQVTRAIRSSLDLVRIFDISSAHIAEFLKAEVSIVQYRPDLGCWYHLVTYNRNQDRLDKRDLVIPEQNNPFSDQLKQLQMVRVDDTDQIEDPVNQDLAQSFSGSWLLTPISCQGQIWGSLSLARRNPHHPWQSEEITLAQRVADQLGLGIQQAQMYQQLQRELIERQKVEADLRASRELFSLAALAVDGMIYDLDVPEWTTRRLGLFETLGYNFEEIDDSGDGWTDLIHPEDRERVAQQIRIDLEQRTPNHRSLEYRVRHKQGHYVHLMDYAVILRDQQGQATRIVGHSLDVTERRQIELKLQQQLEQTRLINHITQQIRRSLDLDPILSTAVTQIRDLLKVDRVVIYRFLPDYEGEVIAESVDPQFLPLLNRVISDPCFKEKRLFEVYQQGWISMIEDVDRAQIQPCHLELLHDLQVRANLVVPILVDQQLWGLLIAHHCSGPHPWSDWDAEVMKQLARQLGIGIQQSILYSQLQSSNRELSYQVHVRNAQLHQALDLEALLRLIIEEVRDSLEENQILETTVEELTRGLDLIGCRINFPRSDGCSFRAVSCYPPQDPLICPEPEPIEQTFMDYLGRCRSVLRTQLYPGAATTILSCGIREGEELYAWLDLLRSPDQEFSQPEIRLAEQVANQCAIGIRQARLFQASQQQIQQLTELNHMKEEFVHMVSHELRTPLTNMKMSLTLLNNFDLPERGTRYLQILKAECEREITLVNELLDLQAIESGRRALAICNLDLNNWLWCLIESFQDRAEERQQQLQIEIPDQPLTLRTDKDLLERVVSELINNACKYTPPQHRIRICLQATPTGIQIEVENTGSEIPIEALPSLFDKFYRIPQVDRWRQGGTGLGLALVKRAVQCLGGQIRVRTGPALTCFRVEIPDLDPVEDDTEPEPTVKQGTI